MLTTRLYLILLSASMLLGACATSGEAEGDDKATKTAQKVEPFDGHLRLSDKVVPQHYRLSLDVDPAKETFSGLSHITVELAEETQRVDLHGEGLTYERVWANVRKAKYDAKVVEGKNGGITMVFSEPLGPGKVDLVFDYTAPLGQKPHGLYRVQDGEDWYAFTQFQPLWARRAFPSFDEPRFKTPYEVIITVPGDGQKAFANTLPKRIIDQDDSVDDDVTYHFEETKPLPTYLVAFAVGPLEVTEAPKGAIPGVPLRAITTKGKSHLAKYALEKAPAILKAQTDYFGMKLPFSKIDLVAVPNFHYGAMENVGLVTFRERLLLVDADQSTPGVKYALQSVMAHEFAHMWFGNYVTPTWWNDLWLNEAFATWMATRTIAEVAPELEPRIDAVEGSLRVMSSDALSDARAIRQPIRVGGDVMNAFDGITYTKGRAVLGMLESWIGEDDFREGVRNFLKANAYGNGTTKKLFAAWAEADGRPVAPIMSTFLDQPGTPLIRADLSCTDDGYKVTFAQSRYLPAGSTAEKNYEWKVPVCYRFGAAGKKSGKECELVDSQHVEVKKSLDYCPEWIHPNAGEAGYYHWRLPGDQLKKLVTEHRDELTTAEKVALLPHAGALVEAHALSMADYLKLVEEMAREDHRVIVEQVIDAVNGLEEHVVDDKNRAAFTVWAKKVIGPHAKRLGFAPKKGEPVEDGLLRPKVIYAAANLAGDKKLRKKADTLVKKYLQDPTSVPIPQAKLALRIAAIDGDQKLWQKLVDAVDKAPTPAARAATISALGSFRDPAITKKALELLMTDTLRTQDAWTLIGPTLGEPETRKVTWAWLQQNYDSVVKKFGETTAKSFPWIGSAFCSTERKKEVQAFFGKEERQVTGMKRNLGQALESIDRCVRYREYVAEDAREFLESQATARK